MYKYIYTCVYLCVLQTNINLYASTSTSNIRFQRLCGSLNVPSTKKNKTLCRNSTALGWKKPNHTFRMRP